MEITCYRDAERGREARWLPGPTYNLARTLLGRSPSGTLFVPIRAMQYLAILDREEFVFIDGRRQAWIDIAWQHFLPRERNSIDDRVAYEAVFYHPEGKEIMQRLLTEFPRALQVLAAKTRYEGSARVLEFPG
jgi:hypothetical protein